MADSAFSIRRWSIGAAGVLIGAAVVTGEPAIALWQGPLAGKGLLDLDVSTWFTRDEELQLPPRLLDRHPATGHQSEYARYRCTVGAFSQPGYHPAGESVRGVPS